MQYEDIDCELINMDIDGKCHLDSFSKTIRFDLDDGRSYTYKLTPDGWEYLHVVKDKFASKFLKLLKDEYPNGVDEVNLGKQTTSESMRYQLNPLLEFLS